MTLSEHLNNYMTTYCLTGKEAARRMGLGGTQISEVRLHNKYSQPTAEKICKVLGLEFADYLEYSTCPICGEKYIKETSIQATCKSNECRDAHRIARVKAYDADIRSGKRKVKKHYPERKSTRRVFIEEQTPKPSVTFAEYNERARAQGLTYGQLQVLERLGLNAQRL